MKGLVETRARVDAEYSRLATLIDELNAKIAKVEAERNSCDQLITKLNARIQANQIEPINGWQGRYGTRGALKFTILQALQIAYPNELTTSVIANHLQNTFDLLFITANERRTWVHHTVNNRLNALARAKLIERTHNSEKCTGHPGTWRWIPPDSTSVSLQALAAHAGLPTVGALDIDDLALEPAPEEDDLPR